MSTGELRPERDKLPINARGLQTARATLKVLRLLESAPQGISISQAATALGKSQDTARYLLNSLQQEGYAVRYKGGSLYYPTRMFAIALTELEQSKPCPPSILLGAALAHVYNRTRLRAYLASISEHGVTMLDIRGHQGQPRIPGLQSTIPLTSLHALAVGKIFMAEAMGSKASVPQGKTVACFTNRTLTDFSSIQHELEEVRENGYAIDREEFASGLCCIAAPIEDVDGKVFASLAVSMSSHSFDLAGRRYITAVLEAAKLATEQVVEWQHSEQSTQLADERGV